MHQMLFNLPKTTYTTL